MVNKSTLIYLAALAGLCGWIWFQRGAINDLRAENQAQASLIAEQEKVRKIIKSQPCYNTRIYDDAIERLH